MIARQCLKIGSMWETSIYRSQDLCFKGQNNQPAHLLLKISFVQAKLTRIAAKRNLRLCIAISQNGSPKTKINLPSSNLNNSPITKKSQATPYQARKPSLSKPVAHQSPKLMKSTKAWVKTTRILVLSTWMHTHRQHRNVWVVITKHHLPTVRNYWVMNGIKTETHPLKFQEMKLLMMSIMSTMVECEGNLGPRSKKSPRPSTPLHQSSQAHLQRSIQPTPTITSTVNNKPLRAPLTTWW